MPAAINTTPQFCVAELKDMLLNGDQTPKQNRALRFALHFLTKPKPPRRYWRYVEYSDDGCAVYECLSCEHRWEGRSEPGWFDCFEDCEPDAEGVQSYSQGDKVRYYRKREVPVYKPVWKYCPCCGVEWIGPIRSNVDNERMLGPRRLAIQNAIDNQPFGERHRPRNEPRFWWVLQERTVWGSDRAPDPWSDRYKANPNRVGAVAMHKRLIDERGMLNLDDKLFDTTDEVRVVKRTPEQLQRSYLSEVYS